MIESQLEIIAQGKRFLQHINKTDYQQILAPHFSSSAGAHMRHLLDHYFAVINGSKSGLIDYNIRDRHSPAEHSPQAAIEKWLEIETWMRQLDESSLSQKLQVITEISLSQKINSECESNLGRELIFVSSHAVHHYSLLAVMAKLQGHPIEADLGIAPVTATYLRNQKDTAS